MSRVMRKPVFRGFRAGQTQTRSWLEASNFGFRDWRDCTIYVAKNKGADQLFGYCAADLHTQKQGVTMMRLICVCLAPFRVAKEKKVRIWKDYTPTSPTISIKDKTFQGKVRFTISCTLIFVSYKHKLGFEDARQHCLVVFLINDHHII